MSTQTGHFYTPSRILRMAELTRLLGISRSTIYENESGIKILRCHLSRPVRLGSSAVGWRASAIDEWLTLHTTPTRSVTKDK